MRLRRPYGRGTHRYAAGPPPFRLTPLLSKTLHVLALSAPRGRPARCRPGPGHAGGGRRSPGAAAGRHAGGRSAPGCRSAPAARSWCAARHGVGLLDAGQALAMREEGADHLVLQLAGTPAGRSAPGCRSVPAARPWPCARRLEVA